MFVGVSVNSGPVGFVPVGTCIGALFSKVVLRLGLTTVMLKLALLLLAFKKRIVELVIIHQLTPPPDPVSSLSLLISCSGVMPITLKTRTARYAVINTASINRIDNTSLRSKRSFQVLL